MSQQVDQFVERQKNWRTEMMTLREILQRCDLDETIKWGKPCYSNNSKNIAIIQPFKDDCALMFFKGSILKDPNKLLEKPGANSEVAKRMMFRSVDEIRNKEKAIMNFVREAIENEKPGIQVSKKKPDLILPKELKNVLTADAEYNEAFHKLTPGRQRSYALYISQARQAATRISRAEKCKVKVLEGKGYNER